MLITKELSTVRELRSERFIGCDAHKTGIKPMFILTIARAHCFNKQTRSPSEAMKSMEFALSNNNTTTAQRRRRQSIVYLNELSMPDLVSRAFVSLCSYVTHVPGLNNGNRCYCQFNIY